MRRTVEWKLLQSLGNRMITFFYLGKFKGLAFISTCCLRYKLVVVPLLSFCFAVIPLRDSKDESRQLHCKSQQLVYLCFCSSADKMQGHSVLWKSFLLTSYTLIAGVKIQKQGRAESQKFQQISCIEQGGEKVKRGPSRQLPFFDPKSVLPVFMWKQQKRIVEKAQASKTHLPEINAVKCPVHLVLPALNFPSPLPLKPISESSVCLSKVLNSYSISLTFLMLLCRVHPSAQVGCPRKVFFPFSSVFALDQYSFGPVTQYIPTGAHTFRRAWTWDLKLCWLLPWSS